MIDDGWDRSLFVGLRGTLTMAAWSRELWDRGELEDDMFSRSNLLGWAQLHPDGPGPLPIAAAFDVLERNRAGRERDGSSLIFRRGRRVKRKAPGLSGSARPS